MLTPQDNRLIVSSGPTGQLIAFRRLLHAVASNLSYNNGTSSPRSFCDSSGLLRICAERSAVTELPTILSDRIGVSHSAAHASACHDARVGLSYIPPLSPPARDPRPRRAAYRAACAPVTIADPAPCPMLTSRPNSVRESRCRRRAKHVGAVLLEHRRNGLYMLIIDGTTEGE